MSGLEVLGVVAAGAFIAFLLFSLACAVLDKEVEE